MFRGPKTEGGKKKKKQKPTVVFSQAKYTLYYNHLSSNHQVEAMGLASADCGAVKSASNPIAILWTFSQHDGQSQCQLFSPGYTKAYLFKPFLKLRSQCDHRKMNQQQADSFPQFTKLSQS